MGEIYYAAVTGDLVASRKAAAWGALSTGLLAEAASVEQLDGACVIGRGRP